MILPDSLNVWRDTQHVGTLWRGTDGRLMGFEYNDTWRQNGHAISYSLPLSQKAWQPQDLLAHHWFANLLPEEQARAALIKRLGIPDDDFSLLATIGGDCAGALTILPSDHMPPSRALPSSLDDNYRELPLDRLAQWAGARERYALMNEGALAKRPRLSLAGAQDKIPVRLWNDTLYLPIGIEPSTHILKFAVEGREQVILNELYLNNLARLGGIACPRTTMVYAGRHPYLMVERYDRLGIESGHVERLHQEDLCQAMGVSRNQKYEAYGGPRFGEIVQTVREACRPSAASIQQLLRWQIFNVLVGNSDGHAKNVSLLQDSRGRWQIAPAYDLVGTIVLGYDSDMAFSLGGEFNSMQLLPRDWQAFSEECRFSYPFVKRQIQQMVTTLADLSDSVILKEQLQQAGLEGKGWTRLQQQRQHIQKQCRRAERW